MGLFFCAHFYAVTKLVPPREAEEKSDYTGGAEYASKDHTVLPGMQATQLFYHEEQKERPRSTGNEQVLPFLQKAHISQGNQIKRKAGNRAHVGKYQKNTLEVAPRLSLLSHQKVLHQPEERNQKNCLAV